jgi:uncharacterized protein
MKDFIASPPGKIDLTLFFKQRRYSRLAMGTLNAVIWLSVALLCDGCDIDLHEMDKAEQAHNERQAQERPAFMSLETAFPEKSARELAEAASKGDVARIESLIADGVDVNSSGTKNVTPLFWGLTNYEGFEALLRNGADPNIVFDKSTVVYWAAELADTRFLRAALRYGGDPNLATGSLGESPLMAAVLSANPGRIESMKVLLAAGANIDARTQGVVFGAPAGGDTAAMLAAAIGRYDIVYFLLRNGANPDVENSSGIGIRVMVENDEGAYLADSDAERWRQKVRSLLHGAEEKP